VHSTSPNHGPDSRLQLALGCFKPSVNATPQLFTIVVLSFDTAFMLGRYDGNIPSKRGVDMVIVFDVLVDGIKKETLTPRTGRLQDLRQFISNESTRLIALYGNNVYLNRRVHYK